MTLPDGVWPRLDKIPRTGIVLALFPFESEYNIQIQRAPDDGGGDPDVGSAIFLNVLPPGTAVLVDVLQGKDAIWHYHWRHVRENYTAGDYTPWLAARARAIPKTLPPLPKSPLLNFSLRKDPTTDEVFIEADAETWLKSIQWEVETDGNWPDLDDGGTSCSALDANGDASVGTGTTLLVTETARVEVRFYAQDSCGGNIIGTLRQALAYDTDPAPQMTVDASYTASEGKVTVKVWDSDLIATALEFAKKTDAGDYGAYGTGWDTSTGVAGTDDELDRTESVTRIPKHEVGIKVRLSYTKGGTAKTDIREFNFGPKVVSEVTISDVSFAADGDVVISGNGDIDTADMYVTADSSEPDDPTVGVNDGTIAGREGTVDTGVFIDYGETAFVKLVGADSGANLGEVVSAQKYREILPPAMDNADATVHDDGTDEDYTVTWAPNAAVTNAAHDLVIEFWKDDQATPKNIATEGSPATTTTALWTDVGAGAGDQDFHYAVLQLIDASDEVLWSVTTRRKQSTV